MIPAAALAASLAMALAGCSDVRPATRLSLAVDAIELLSDACPANPIPAVVGRRDGATMVFADAFSGEPVSILWPVGFAAWDVQGVATLHATDGTVVGREGDSLVTIRGVTGVRGDALRVCAVGTRPYR